VLAYLHFDLGHDLIVGRNGMFTVEVKVHGFATKDSDGRKSYTKGTVIKWDVEFGSLTLELLVSSIANELNVPSNQLPTVWFFDKRLHEDVRLISEIQMVDVFEMYKEEMGCQLVVGLFDNDAEFDDLQPLCAIPVEVRFEIPNNDFSIADEPNSAATNNPEAPEPSTAAANNPEADTDLETEQGDDVDVEPKREPDIFDNPKEYVGVDDEQIYISVPNAQQAANAQPVNNAYDHGDAHPSDENASANAQPVPEEYDEVDDADPLEVHVLHDPENPNIVKGALFPDIIAFRKAIRHHAVKTGFEFAGLKTDKTRFLAHCAAKGCPWRIHASTIFDKKQ